MHNRYDLWLAGTESLTAQALDQLLGWHGDAQGIWRAVGDGTAQGPASVLKALRAHRSESLLDEMAQAMADTDTRLIMRDDPAYPPLLRALEDAPIGLFVRGAADLTFPRHVAIVGSRRCTRYGMQNAARIAAELVACDVHVVSGMARGIDTAANMGCADAGGVSVAVLGCGADVAYPPENEENIQRLLACGGAVVTEYPPGALPLAHRFPRRNRIISGMCSALVVVEAAERSGAMITVRCALDQGREVFALPGPVDSPNSKMPLQILREGAAMATCAQDILENLRWLDAPPAVVDAPCAPDITPAPQADLPGLSEDQRRVAQCLSLEPLGFEELRGRTGFSVPALNSHLTMLEIQEIIEQLPGRMYRRIR
ncbi:MAG: DNA-processing protein DprA [Oscillospiraceae bacterium]|jgi:DNA processing protein|nr:DNA-processing protein DprA [Oscillospiraceae bacterium]